jgi:quinoprotein glucose dehydrogenase
VDLPNTGQPSHAHALLTRSLLIYGEGRTGRPRLHAVNKLTGESVAVIDLPAPSSGHPMTYMHEGKQYIIVPAAGRDLPGSLVALRLP